MNIIILTFCYFIYCVLIYISYILHCIFLYQFVNEKVENQIKSNQIKIKSNMMVDYTFLKEQHQYIFKIVLSTDFDLFACMRASYHGAT